MLEEFHYADDRRANVGLGQREVLEGAWKERPSHTTIPKQCRNNTNPLTKYPNATDKKSVVLSPPFKTRVEGMWCTQ